MESRVVSIYVLGGDVRDECVDVTNAGFEDGVADCEEVWVGAEVVGACDGETAFSEDDDGTALL